MRDQTESSPPTLEPSSVAGTDDLGLVMGGGGARAAYQVGFLRCLADRFPDLSIPILTGVSAGAINAAHLAAHHGSFRQAVDELTALWSTLTIEQVFRVDAPALTKNLVRWGSSLVWGGAGRGAKRLRSLVDTRPLRDFLLEALHCVDGELTGIGANLARGRLRAVALSTASYTTGQSVTWVQGDDIAEWERPNRVARTAVLSIDHVMASAALPLFFPAVRIEDAWYGDGGMRLTAPLSPALHLGANRVIAISTKHERSAEEAERPQVVGYPPPAQVLGVMLNSIFLDLLDQDAFRLERLNRLIDQLPPERRSGLRHVELLVLRPSQDLGRLANQYEPQLPRGFRFLTRNLGTRRTGSQDSLSLVLFQPDYLSRLIDLGERDAYARADEIDRFIGGGTMAEDRP